MLHRIPKSSLQLQIHIPSSKLLPLTPRNPLNESSFEHNYRNICNILLSITGSRSLLKGLQLHSYIVKSGFSTIDRVCCYLINFYSKSQLPHCSRQIFEETPVKSTTTWNYVISAFAQNELASLAIDYFRRMLDDGVRPDDNIFPSVTKACGILSRCDIGQSVRSFAVKTGYDSDVFMGSSMVDMYAKCRKIREARKMFDEMPERNVVSWSEMTCAYAQMGENEEALRLFKQALVEDLEVNDFTFPSVVRVCGNSMLLELGKQIHGLCLKMSYNSSSFVGSSLISMYSKCGVIEDAYRFFHETPIRNLGMWNAMLTACAQHAHAERVFNLFKQMEGVGMKPDSITFLSVLCACRHAGLVEKGQFYFELMKEQGIEPRAQHYTSMVDLLARTGKLKDAFSIIKEMPMEPTEYVWGALLTGCQIHGDTGLASYVADRIFELGPVSSGGIQVMLWNAYAAAGRYKEAARARKMLRDQGVKEETGLSWVEERNRIHTFAAGDRSHRYTKEIYQKLEELGDEMVRGEYRADASFVLPEVGGEEKNQSIRYHSERLAIAFGLISFPPERPIRVMKSLRVCSDCHTAIKFMSKCSGRIIIVRDNKRFHRFEDGKCSCPDYW